MQKEKGRERERERKIQSLSHSPADPYIILIDNFNDASVVLESGCVGVGGSKIRARMHICNCAPTPFFQRVLLQLLTPTTLEGSADRGHC